MAKLKTALLRAQETLLAAEPGVRSFSQATSAPPQSQPPGTVLNSEPSAGTLHKGKQAYSGKVALNQEAYFLYCPPQMVCA